MNDNMENVKLGIYLLRQYLSHMVSDQDANVLLENPKYTIRLLDLLENSMNDFNLMVEFNNSV